MRAGATRSALMVSQLCNHAVRWESASFLKLSNWCFGKAWLEPESEISSSAAAADRRRKGPPVQGDVLVQGIGAKWPAFIKESLPFASRSRPSSSAASQFPKTSSSLCSGACPMAGRWSRTTRANVVSCRPTIWSFPSNFVFFWTESSFAKPAK